MIPLETIRNEYRELMEEEKLSRFADCIDIVSSSITVRQKVSIMSSLLRLQRLGFGKRISRVKKLTKQAVHDEDLGDLSYEIFASSESLYDQIAALTGWKQCIIFDQSNEREESYEDEDKEEVSDPVMESMIFQLKQEGYEGTALSKVVEWVAPEFSGGSKLYSISYYLHKDLNRFLNFAEANDEVRQSGIYRLLEEILDEDISPCNLHASEYEEMSGKQGVGYLVYFISYFYEGTYEQLDSSYCYLATRAVKLWMVHLLLELAEAEFSYKEVEVSGAIGAVRISA